MRELARDPTPGRQQGLKGGLSLVDALEHAGHGVRDSVETRAAHAWLIQSGHGLVALAAPVFAVGRWAASLSAAALEPLGKRCAHPGIRHRYPKTVDMLQSEGPWRVWMVVGVGGQDGSHLTRPQADADVNHPQQTSGTRRLAQGQALEAAGRVDADDRESYHPIDDGLRARGVLAAKSPGE